MIKVIVFVLLNITFINSSYCAQLKEPQLSTDRLSKVIKKYQFVTIGEARFTILFWKLYRSKLLTTSGNYPVNFNDEKLIYEINYLASISSSELINRTVEQWQHLKIPKVKYQGYLSSLASIWPDISKGDKLALFIDKGRSLFYFNDNYIGEIDSPEFGQIFLDIWLSENTSEPSLRRDLLGINNNE
ncbi:chalcone isomerase family protein [Thalassotalea piscium]|uniref:Chalcone isomerase domain-containing protein n=1 Tax=Thalassotalea piscium TaxID=1230533 RepID=A0A7X0NH85_9GAMM|nr:chalcone isomerase family protein [Thalassotalea piscium]MBB6543261.1 hypothetical protein [Thalassotalea piscium]